MKEITKIVTSTFKCSEMKIIRCSSLKARERCILSFKYAIMFLLTLAKRDALPQFLRFFSNLISCSWFRGVD